MFLLPIHAKLPTGMDLDFGPERSSGKILASRTELLLRYKRFSYLYLADRTKLTISIMLQYCNRVSVCLSVCRLRSFGVK